jgi:hypothetical protein
MRQAQLSVLEPPLQHCLLEVPAQVACALGQLEVVTAQVRAEMLADRAIKVPVRRIRCA